MTTNIWQSSGQMVATSYDKFGNLIQIKCIEWEINNYKDVFRMIQVDFQNVCTGQILVGKTHYTAFIIKNHIVLLYWGTYNIGFHVKQRKSTTTKLSKQSVLAAMRGLMSLIYKTKYGYAKHPSIIRIRKMKRRHN